MVREALRVVAEEAATDAAAALLGGEPQQPVQRAALLEGM